VGLPKCVLERLRNQKGRLGNSSIEVSKQEIHQNVIPKIKTLQTQVIFMISIHQDIETRQIGNLTVQELGVEKEVGASFLESLR
jgi:predicted lipase